MMTSRHGVNSIPELELIILKNELELINFELELKFPKFNPEINLPFLQCEHLHVVLPIYWNHNDPELWFLYIYIYIYIYIRYALTVAPK